MRFREFAVGVGFGSVATWMVVGVVGSASGVGDRGIAADHMRSGHPCRAQLTLKINGRGGTPVISYGPATITGVLHCGLAPIRHAQVAVASVGCLPTGVQPIVGSVTTRLDGSFIYTVPPGPDGSLSFSYTVHSDDPGPSVAAIATLRVRPRMGLRIEPIVVRNRHTIYWTVTVLGGPFPTQGITLDPQVKEGGRWQTFDQFRLYHEGTSRIYRYTFRKTSKSITYGFRVALPATGSGEYPYEVGASNVVNVRVNP